MCTCARDGVPSTNHPTAHWVGHRISRPAHRLPALSASTPLHTPPQASKPKLGYGPPMVVGISPRPCVCFPSLPLLRRPVWLAVALWLCVALLFPLLLVLALPLLSPFPFPLHILLACCGLLALWMRRWHADAPLWRLRFACDVVLPPMLHGLSGCWSAAARWRSRCRHL